MYIVYLYVYRLVKIQRSGRRKMKDCRSKIAFQFKWIMDWYWKTRKKKDMCFDQKALMTRLLKWYIYIKDNFIFVGAKWAKWAWNNVGKSVKDKEDAQTWFDCLNRALCVFFSICTSAFSHFSFSRLWILPFTLHFLAYKPVFDMFL